MSKAWKYLAPLTLKEARLRHSYGRKNLVDYDLAVNAVEKMKLDKIYNENSYILDAYPGNGVFSTALHNIIKPKKITMLEIFPLYNKVLTEHMVNKSPEDIELLPYDPFKWSTYDKLFMDKIVVPENTDSKDLNKSMLFVINMTGEQGRQLLSQFASCIAHKNWIYKYGRMKMLAFVRGVDIPRTALEGTFTRFSTKTALMLNIYADINPILGRSHPKLKELQFPVEIGIDDIHPKVTSYNKEPQPALFEITPRYRPELDDIDVPTLEFIISSLLYAPTRPLRESLDCIHPGTFAGISKSIEDILDTPAGDLPADSFIRVARAFYNWPFKPTSYFEVEIDRNKEKSEVLRQWIPNS